MTTLSELAGQAYDYMETAERTDGDSFIRVKDAAPEWMRDLVRESHGTEMLPDDWRFDCIHSALGAIHDSGADRREDCDDLMHEFADGQVDTYNTERAKWLASHIDRASFCDQAREDGLLSEDADIYYRIGIGQYTEAQEVFNNTLNALVKRLEECEEEEEVEA